MFCVAKLHTIASQHRVPRLAMFNSFIPIPIWLSLVNAKRVTHFPLNFDLALSNTTTLSQSILCGISRLCTCSATADLELWSKLVASVLPNSYCQFSPCLTNVFFITCSTFDCIYHILQSLLLSERLVSRDFLRKAEIIMTLQLFSQTGRRRFFN